MREAINRVLPGVRADLDALIRIQSVSADPGAAGEVRRSAELSAELLAASGAAETRILDGVGAPAVVARFPAPAGQPTILLYAHHDVQPAGDLADWTSPPFEPTVRHGRLYARGSADDKAGVAAHLAALRAHDGRPPIGVTVLIEGEEEIGSPSLGAFLKLHADELAADVVLLADSDNLDTDVPSLTTTLRGLVNCIVEVRALHHAVHSGTYGGAAPDALTALCRLLASLHDPDGTVAVPGLRSAPTPGTRLPEHLFRAEAAMLDGVQLLGSGNVAEQLWARPAATVLAIESVPVAAAANSLAPVARAKLSLRIAPGDDVPRARASLAAHLAAHAPWGVQVTVTDAEHGAPFAADTTGPQYDAARRAYGLAYGTAPVDIGAGGSIPFVARFADAFPDAAILVTSAGADADSRAHGTDESLPLGAFAKACLAEALLLGYLARRA